MHLGTNGPTAQIRTAVGVEKQVQFNTIFQLLNEREKVSFGRFHLYTTPAGIFVQRLVSWKCAFFLHEICCESSLSKACVTTQSKLILHFLTLSQCFYVKVLFLFIRLMIDPGYDSTRRCVLLRSAHQHESRLQLELKYCAVYFEICTALMRLGTFDTSLC